MSEQRVEPYTDPVAEPIELTLKTLEYRMPFNYANVTVHREYRGGEPHGVEMFPIRTVEGKTTSGLPSEYIEIRDERPMVRVAVIGSACTPPGWVQIECDLAEPRRKGDIEATLPARFRIDNLWGMHLRYDQWNAGPGEPLNVRGGDEHYPPQEDGKLRIKAVSNEFPMTGMNCAIFEIPPSKAMRIMAGSQIPGWTGDNYADDAHYSINIIRTSVVAS